MDDAYYVLGDHAGSRSKVVPRSLLGQLPEVVRVFAKRKTRTLNCTTSSRPVLMSLDMSESAGATPFDDAAYSDNDLDFMVIANQTTTSPCAGSR
jgi:hypothetical protein